MAKFTSQWFKGSNKQAKIARAIKRAHFILAWERLWPLLLPFLLVLALFFIISWFGIWVLLPDMVRLPFVFILVLACFAALFEMRHFQWPDISEACHHVEKNSKIPHQLLAALDDPLATSEEDKASYALWQLHKAQSFQAIQKLSVGLPAPRNDRRDPFAVRFIFLLLFCVAFFYAGDQRSNYLIAAFSGLQSTSLPPRIDAWISPPAYTNRPPIFLTKTEGQQSPNKMFEVPQGSTLFIRAGHVIRAGLAADIMVYAAREKMGRKNRFAIPPLQSDKLSSKALTPQQEPIEYSFVLDQDIVIDVEHAGHIEYSWPLAIIIDKKPKIWLEKKPTVAVSGAFELRYAIEDDYGVVKATADFKQDKLFSSVPMFPFLRRLEIPPRALVAPPNFVLNLPKAQPQHAVGRTLYDLTAHPWAGSIVTMTLVAHDEADQMGSSKPIKITLPQRQFSKPLAKALIEQRRILALDANARHHVASALDILMVEPARFIDDKSVYLGIYVVRNRIANAKNDDQLRAALNFLWTIALSIEDGILSEIKEELRSAQEKLRKALENGASSEDIRRLMADMRQILNGYLQELTRQASRENFSTSFNKMDPHNQTIYQQDLQKMLDQIEELARIGAIETAQKLLFELQHMLENIKPAHSKTTNSNNEQQRQMHNAFSQFADVIKQQQQLMDDTFRATSSKPVSNPDFFSRNNAQRFIQESFQQTLKTGEGKKQKSDIHPDKLNDLIQKQESLYQQLQEMIESLQGHNVFSKGLDKAQQEMKSASQSLNENMMDDAIQNQGQALSAMRNAMREMARKMMGEGGQAGIYSSGNLNRDPLGRWRRQLGPELDGSIKVPDKIDIQRARKILQEIRNRLSEHDRLLFERDYLERLLQYF